MVGLFYFYQHFLHFLFGLNEIILLHLNKRLNNYKMEKSERIFEKESMINKLDVLLEMIKTREIVDEVDLSRMKSQTKKYIQTLRNEIEKESNGKANGFIG